MEDRKPRVFGVHYEGDQASLAALIQRHDPEGYCLPTVGLDDDGAETTEHFYEVVTIKVDTRNMLETVEGLRVAWLTIT